MLNEKEHKELEKRIDEYIDRSTKEFERVTKMQDGSHAMDVPAVFYGGRLDGLRISHKELMEYPNKGYTPRWSAMKEHNWNLVNLKLEDQPIIEGYLSPMLDGGNLRYETQEVYDANSD